MTFWSLSTNLNNYNLVAEPDYIGTDMYDTYDDDGGDDDDYDDNKYINILPVL